MRVDALDTYLPQKHLLVINHVVYNYRRLACRYYLIFDVRVTIFIHKLDYFEI